MFLSANLQNVKTMQFLNFKKKGNSYNVFGSTRNLVGNNKV